VNLRVPSLFPRSRRHSRGQSLVEFAVFLPIVLVLLVGIGDMSRLFNTMINIEAAAREAADSGTLYPWQWDPVNAAGTVAEMERRACVAASNLPEYAGDDLTCTNPTFSYSLDTPPGVNADECHLVPRSSLPCNVVVTLEYTFNLAAPTGLIPFPASYTFYRTSVFAVSDFEVDVP
jgi:Flp pilus assembly protein TadG